MVEKMNGLSLDFIIHPGETIKEVLEDKKMNQEEEIVKSKLQGIAQKVKNELMSNPDLKNKIEEFERLRYEVQLMQYTGENKDEEKSKKLEKMYAELIQNELIKQYFDLEVKFNVMITDVNKIIAEAIRDVL